MKITKNLFFLCLVFVLSCQEEGPVVLNTDFKLELKTRTFGAGAGYLISSQGLIEKDGSIEFRDIKVEDAVKKLLCEYQNINCNGKSSKVVIKNPNKTLANYVFIDDNYKGAKADQKIISQAIMKKLEEARVISVNERIGEVPRYIIEEIDETKLKALQKPVNKYFQNQRRCTANQADRNNNPSNAAMKNMGTVSEFIGDLSFCLGIDIFVSDEVKSLAITKENMLFDINTTDQSEKLIPNLNNLGLIAKKYMVKTKYYEINVTPYMVNLTKEGQKRR